MQQKYSNTEIQRRKLADTLMEAFNMYRQTDPKSAERVLKQVIDLRYGPSQFMERAHDRLQLAELYESAPTVFHPREVINVYDATGEMYLKNGKERHSSSIYYN